MIDDDLPQIRKVRDDLMRADRTLNVAVGPRWRARTADTRAIADAQYHVRAARLLLDAAIAGAAPIVEHVPLRVVQ